MQTTPPAVSVIMANYNGAGRVGCAVRSVLRQTERSLELIFSDDGSNDSSVAEALAAAAGDPRFMVVTGGPRSGPAGARNRGIERASGRWLAVVDNDDYIHPERLERLVGQAEADGAHIAADDMLVFYESGARPHALLKGVLARAPFWVSAGAYALGNRLYTSAPPLGYLKPIVRRERLGRLRYDESLRIGEDFDLVMRLLLEGAHMRVYPEIGYFYRKHAHSISHRMTSGHVAAMVAAHDALGAPGGASTQRQFAKRRASLVTALAFGELVDALKAREFGAAIQVAAKRPQALPLLRYPLLAPLRRLRKEPARAPKAETARIALLSRQRVVGATNGSSAYLLAIVKALSQSGYAVDFIGASPKLFGRWPLFRLKRENAVFASYQASGAWRLGSWLIARDPRRALAALAAALEKLLIKLRLPSPGWSKPAEYAIAAQARRADMLYVAQSVRANTRAVLCDYAFLAPLAPFALAPDAPSLVVMHDLFSARVRDSDDTVAALTPAQEWRLLGQADIVLAIQELEAAAVRAALPRTEVILAPHAVEAAHAAQPGQDDKLLFVGSNTGPNISGLEWFFEACWPLIRAARPEMTLDVAGSVARALKQIPEGVRLLGVVADLAPLYRDAGVVISPLRTGSGLKIKLIEAMAQGKALVATSITAQGVEDTLGESVIITDEAEAFANAVLALARDARVREHLGDKALAVTRHHFSPEACYAPIVERIRAGVRSTVHPPYEARNPRLRPDLQI